MDEDSSLPMPAGPQVPIAPKAAMNNGKWHSVPILTVVRQRSLARQTRLRRGDASLREAAAQAKVSRSVFHRVEHGYMPNVATFVKISRWILTDE